MFFIYTTTRRYSSNKKSSAAPVPTPDMAQCHVTLTWPQSCSRHLCGHEPSQVLDLGFSACWLHWGIDGLEGGRHGLGQVHHADEDLQDAQEEEPLLTQWLISIHPMPRPVGGNGGDYDRPPDLLSWSWLLGSRRENECYVVWFMRGKCWEPRDASGGWEADWRRVSLAVGGGYVFQVQKLHRRRLRGSRAGTLPESGWKEVHWRV